MNEGQITSKCGVQCYLTIFLYIIDKRNKSKRIFEANQSESKRIF
jgi:hypothetical protein